MDSLNPFYNRKRFECPQCGSRHSFARLKEYVEHEDIGYCHNGACKYKNIPKENNINILNTVKVENILSEPKYVAREILDKFMSSDILVNNLSKFIVKLFGSDGLSALRRYYVASNKENKTVFWFVDINNNVRTAKIMNYNDCGKRTEDVMTAPMYTTAHGYTPCLFGEHLVTAKSNIKIVESEKTAILASIIYPKYVWLASGGSNGLTVAKVRSLKTADGHIDILFDADSSGRHGAMSARDTFYKIGKPCDCRDLFPDRSDGWDIGDNIIECVTTGKAHLNIEAPPSLTRKFDADRLYEDLRTILVRHMNANNTTEVANIFNKAASDVLDIKLRETAPVKINWGQVTDTLLKNLDPIYEYNREEMSTIFMKLKLDVTPDDAIAHTKLEYHNGKYIWNYTPF